MDKGGRFKRSSGIYQAYQMLELEELVYMGKHHSSRRLDIVNCRQTQQ